MKYRIPPLLMMGFIIVALVGCSGSMAPIAPTATQAMTQPAGSHQLWGLWQFVADPAAETLEAVPLREAGMHLNALPFLEPPPSVNLGLENIQFNGNVVDCDVVLRHPFVGQVQYTGFDVCGILITRGSTSGFHDPDLLLPSDGDTRMLNTDGYTRWWNPSEFPHTSGIFGYKDGLLGTPHSKAGFNATLNPYKLFCDGLTDPDDPVDGLDATSRCVFTVGQQNVRHYTIKLGDDGLVFNYAVDANWKFPNGTEPWSAPDDFPPAANRIEAWNAGVTELENTLWHYGGYCGGDLSLLVEIWDHYDINLNFVTVESPGSFPAVTSETPVSSGEGYAIYQFDFPEATPGEGSIDILITVRSQATGYHDLLPGKPVSAYFTHNIAVTDEPPGPIECGTGIYDTLIQTPFADPAETVPRLEAANLVSGPYAGEMLLQSDEGIISRYDMGAIVPHTGVEFIVMPLLSLGKFGIIYHIDVEPVTGRVILVTDGWGNNNSMFICDDTGNLLSPENGISVGDGRKIFGVHPNNNGDLWLLTTYRIDSKKSTDSRLERWEYEANAPYYIYDPTSVLDIDEIIGKPDLEYDWITERNIAEITISYSVHRIFVLQVAPMGEDNGRLYAFDINDTGPPTYREDLSNMSLFSQPTSESTFFYYRVAYSAIFCDHSYEKVDRCRIIAYSRTYGNYNPMFVRLDDEGNVLNEKIFWDSPFNHSQGMAIAPASSDYNLVLFGYHPTCSFMSPAPDDW